MREAIDDLDRNVLRLLGRRARYVAAATRFKTDENSVRAPERQKAMLARRRKWAENEGLDPAFIEDLNRRIVSHFISREMDQWRRGQA